MRKFIIAASTIAMLVTPTMAQATMMPKATVVYGTATRPGIIDQSVDGALFLAGLKHGPFHWSDHPNLGHLTWTKWTSQEGRAWGGEWFDNCQPSCGNGLITVEKATLHVWRPVHGVFTRGWLRLYGERIQQMWYARHDGNGWIWQALRPFPF